MSQIKSQQLIFIQSLLEGNSSQVKTIKIGVTEKHDNLKYTIEVRPQNNNILPFRILDKNNEAVTRWNTWSDIEEVENTFRMLSFK